ncbi:MAG: hypothetical protein CO150_09735 [Nitrospirae bacterium CG_4_9_14_3_um_filter_53_35]|nr:MAG: hypothetical protein AUK29_03235 [Nitrospirae bacterium CG2_30_53_67]PIS36494.1 MAG: hypothetical protein COT35_10830 [Nitrospirae bacterium CG08_land_8_20_14_0_20_52_24]PIV83099.1 MAG: hypothetical protein COW52_10185 [Nitrospirae bacterium CG17_big_fil_post_rev_8_21_14_2_50_50_9]PIW85563.1 MAG: hypothetical protein COZ95_03870 [Nitrospirae bacterium CG_4_8_14_3_um_filter_50_41]PJA72838.1 MAG: hypothetical protein CO150_09735 [Nitrospirae bacterium CG_4_9_14_3_um_filter_53_35]
MKIHKTYFFLIFLLCAACLPPYDLKNFSSRSDGGESKKQEKISSPDEFFLNADQLFHDGKYRSALHDTRRIYEEAHHREVEEEALFRIILIQSYGDNPNRDYREAGRVAKAFLKNYPGSKRSREVQAILLLIEEIHRSEAEAETLKGYNAIQDEKIQRLMQDIRKIKEIDLQLEEQKKKLE